jgi:hypothetical protein
VLPRRLHAELLYDVVNLNMTPNSLHPTQTPSVMFERVKFDLKKYIKPTFGSTAVIHQAGKEVTPRSQLGIVLSYVNGTNGHQIRAWIVHDNRVKIRSFCTVIKAYPRDLNFPYRNVTVQSRLPDFLPTPKLTVDTVRSPLIASPGCLCLEYFMASIYKK